MFPDWMMQTFREVVSEGPFGVEMGFAFDGYFLPKEMVVGLFETAKKAGIKIVTSHYCRGAMLGKSRRSPYPAKRTKANPLSSIFLNPMGSTTLIAHASDAISSDAFKTP